MGRWTVTQHASLAKQFDYGVVTRARQNRIPPGCDVPEIVMFCQIALAVCGVAQGDHVVRFVELSSTSGTPSGASRFTVALPAAGSTDCSRSGGNSSAAASHCGSSHGLSSY